MLNSLGESSLGEKLVLYYRGEKNTHRKNIYTCALVVIVIDVALMNSLEDSRWDWWILKKIICPIWSIFFLRNTLPESKSIFEEFWTTFSKLSSGTVFPSSSSFNLVLGRRKTRADGPKLGLYAGCNGGAFYWNVRVTSCGTYINPEYHSHSCVKKLTSNP